MRRPALPLALAALFALASFSLAPARPANAAAGDQRIGYELPDIGPGSGAGIVFVDALQQSSPWSSTSADALALDQLGNVASLRVGQAAERTIYTTESYPAGDYTLLYQGTGKFEAAGGVLEPGSAGRLTLHVVPNAGAGLRLRLIATDAKNPVRDVRLILPGYEAVYATHPFAPAFVRSLQGWNVLRFAQWSHADSFVGNAVWPARPHVDRPTQISPDGVALEYMVELANQTGADPWFALPAGATDGYVYGIADLVHRTLDPRLHAIFQYGNEMWKPGTPGNAYAQMAAHNYRLPGDAQTAAVGWYALRSPKVFEVVRDAFGADAARVVRVVTGPLADANGRNTALSILQRDAAHVDAFAVPATGALGAPGLAATVRLAAAHHLPLFGYAGGETVNPAAGAARTVARQSLSAWHAAGGTLWVGTPSEFALAGIRDYAALHPSSHIAGEPAVAIAIGADRTPVEHPRSVPKPIVGPSKVPALRAKNTLALGGKPGVVGALGTTLARVDLSHEGTLDWVHLGNSPTPDHKSNGQAQIQISAAGAKPASTGFETFGWKDGAAGAGSSTRGVAVRDGAFSLSVPADDSERVLRVFVGVDRAQGVLTATLGQHTYSSTSLLDRVGNRSGVYTLVYRADLPGQRLNVTFAEKANFGGSVALRAASLAPREIKPSASGGYDVAQYHNDLLRTGWNPNETTLTTANVASSAFKLLQTLNVDGNVLAQPLYLSQYALPSQGTHNLLIVATENDSVYEFDADSGAQLAVASMGTSQASGDVGCGDIRPTYGITSTPAIDRSTGTIYLVANTEPSHDNFHTTLHALDIGTLTDKITPVDLSASVKLSNGGTVAFNNQNQYSRASLAWANNSLYIGIGSHCDDDAGGIVGWLMRYDQNLNQLAAFPTIEDNAGYLLSSVWMSGFAPAIGEKGDVFLLTGNGAFDANHNHGHDYGESAIRLKSDLSKVESFFTPHQWQSWNNYDEDFGSGGLMLLPTQTGPYPLLGVAMGKSSTLYLLNAKRLGRESKTDKGALQVVNDSGGGVWGGPTFFSGATGQFVYYQTSGDSLHAYQLSQDGSGIPSLSLTSSGSVGAGYGGSTPIVSSNGQAVGTGIVWLVERGSPNLTLEAYDASDVSSLLFQSTAGTWSNPQNNGFVTPLVANGKVYVPATNTVTMFGLSQ
jgi:hypothetical protein